MPIKKSKIQNRLSDKNKDKEKKSSKSNLKKSRKSMRKRRNSKKKSRKSTFGAVDPVQQQQRIKAKKALKKLLIEQKNQDDDQKMINMLRHNINSILNQQEKVEIFLEKLQRRQLKRQQESGKKQSGINIDDIFPTQNQNIRKAQYQQLLISLEEDIKEEENVLLHNRQEQEIEIQNLKNFIENSLNQARIQEEVDQAELQYETPPPKIDFIRRLQDLNRQQKRLKRRAEHGIRKTGEFIFDYDNMCNNIGLTNVFGQLELYDEIEHFVDTGQLPNNAVIPIEEYGIFQDFNNIPELEDELSHHNRLIFRYGHNKLTVLLPADQNNPNNPADPNHIIGKGSFGLIYQGLMNADKIVIKKLINNPPTTVLDLADVVRETVIQTHLYCQYNIMIETNPNVNIARIPKIVSISKYRNDYYIGMEQLDNNFNDYIRKKFTPTLTNKQADAAFIDISRGVYSIQFLLYELFNKEGFMHRDLHCGNIAYRHIKLRNGNIDEKFYLIDFGMSILVKRKITNNGKSYKKHSLNSSHDMRLLLSSLIQAVGIRNWDLIPHYARIIAKRFSYGVLNGWYNKTKGTIFYEMYSQVINKFDWRFDLNSQNLIFKDFNDIPNEPPTPTPDDIKKLPDDPDNLLLSFVKRFYL